LIDRLRDNGYQPGEVWADRGYCSDRLRDELLERGITPRISQRRKPTGRPEKASLNAALKQEKARRVKDPDARHRWVVERTNAWLRRFRRLTIRTEPSSRVYHAYLTLALIVILARSL
jgi:IS5 family transposase